MLITELHKYTLHLYTYILYFICQVVKLMVYKKFCFVSFFIITIIYYAKLLNNFYVRIIFVINILYELIIWNGK